MVPPNEGRMSGDVIILYATNYKIFHTGRLEYPSKERSTGGRSNNYSLDYKL